MLRSRSYFQTVAMEHPHVQAPRAQNTVLNASMGPHVGTFYQTAHPQHIHTSCEWAIAASFSSSYCCQTPAARVSGVGLPRSAASRPAESPFGPGHWRPLGPHNCCPSARPSGNTLCGQCRRRPLGLHNCCGLVARHCHALACFLVHSRTSASIRFMCRRLGRASATNPHGASGASPANRLCARCCTSAPCHLARAPLRPVVGFLHERNRLCMCV